jgi:hypothetical protein
MAYGFRSSVNNFNKVMFPGDRRNCEMPFSPAGLHQSDASGDCAIPFRKRLSHALVNTLTLGKSCSVYHTPSGEVSVDEVHAS